MARERFEIDHAHSGIRFSMRHMMVTRVRGRFVRWRETLALDDGGLDNSAVQVRIDAASIETGFSDRDAHLSPGVVAALYGDPH
jgi:polyisoprenoid-binding protein YceI